MGNTPKGPKRIEDELIERTPFDPTALAETPIEPDPKSTDFVRRILDHAKAQGLTQLELEKRSGVSRQHIWRVLKGKRGLSIAAAGVLARAVGLTWYEVEHGPRDGLRLTATGARQEEGIWPPVVPLPVAAGFADWPERPEALLGFDPLWKLLRLPWTQYRYVLSAVSDPSVVEGVGDFVRLHSFVLLDTHPTARTSPADGLYLCATRPDPSALAIRRLLVGPGGDWLEIGPDPAEKALMIEQPDQFVRAKVVLVVTAWDSVPQDDTQLAASVPAPKP